MVLINDQYYLQLMIQQMPQHTLNKIIVMFYPIKEEIISTDTKAL
jgi:hypothetical protein